MSDWISTKDRPPEESRAYVVIIDGKVNAAFYDKEVTRFWFVCGRSQYAVPYEKVPTWAKLPNNQPT